MKILCVLSLALVLARPVSARDDAYTMMSRCITPFASIFTQNPKDGNRALQLSLRVEQMTGLPAELANAHADIAVEYPDKLLVRGPVQGEDLTICRNGQEVWMSPGSRAAELLKKMESEKRTPKADPNYTLSPFKLPIPEKDLAFLPVLIHVQDAGDDTVDGVACQVLDLQLNPALSRSLDAQGWTARLWVRKDATPVRLLIARESAWSASIRFDTVEFHKALPPETWQPTPEQAADAGKIRPMRYNQFLRAIVNGK
ncbi:MAG TPA: hypothetical protein VGH90_04675 [Chthoniobacteraceae bacterium]